VMLALKLLPKCMCMSTNLETLLYVGSTKFTRLSASVKSDEF